MASGSKLPTGNIVSSTAVSGISRSGEIMKRRPTTSRTTRRPVPSWPTLAGAFAAAFMAACPVDVTVTLGSPPPQTVVAGQADVPNPVCPIRPR